MSDNEKRESGDRQSGAPRRVRRLLWIVVGLLAVGSLAIALILPRLLDPESYRGQIEQALRDATGWEVELGALSFSLLEGMALTVQPASIQAPGDSSSITIETIAVKAQLMPLLGGELRVDSIELISPEIVLVRENAADGWVVPIAPAPEPGPDAPGQAGTPIGTPAGDSPDSAAEERFSVAVERITVRRGRLHVIDRVADPRLSLELIDVDVESWPATGRLTGSGRLTDDRGALNWHGDFTDGLVVEVNSLATEFLHPWVGEDLLHPGGRVDGEVKIGFPLRFDGSFTANDLALLSAEKPFDEAGGEFALGVDGERWSLERLDVQAGGARVTGSGELLPRLQLRLELPRAPLEAVMEASRSVVPIPLELASPGFVEARIRVDRPVDGTLTYAAEGALAAAGFKPGDLLPAVRDVEATFELDRAGRLEVLVEKGNVGGGPLTGVASIDPIHPPGTLRFEGGIRDAVLGSLLSGMIEQGERVSGPTGLSADVGLDLGGPTLDARALTGRIDLDAREISIPGWDLEGAIRSKIDEKLASLGGAAGLLEGELAKRLGNDSAGSGAANAAAGEVVEQLLDSVQASIDFDRWPWGLENLSLAAGGLTSTGGGSFDPVAGLVDLSVTSLLSRQRTARLVEEHSTLRALVDEQGRLSLPLHIEGPLLSPSVGVEFGDALARQLDTDNPEEAVKGLLKGLLEKKLGGD